MNSSLLIKIAEYCALLSFLGGTAILIRYFFTDSLQTISLGIYYIFIVGIINLAILIMILLKARKSNPYRSKLLDAAKVLLLNIPVLFLYIGIVIVLLGYVRITFKNTTPHQIENVMITGCQEKEIPSLAPEESKTVWIGIPADCSIEITYQHKGKIKQEVIIEYVTSMDGKKMIYEIGAVNN